MPNVYVIGDTENADVRRLFEDLAREGFEPVVWDPTRELPKFVVACFTGRDAQRDVFTLMGASVRILPAVFTGGLLPALLAGTRPADFTHDWSQALDALVRALRKFTAP